MVNCQSPCCIRSGYVSHLRLACENLALVSIWPLKGSWILLQRESVCTQNLFLTLWSKKGLWSKMKSPQHSEDNSALPNSLTFFSVPSNKSSFHSKHLGVGDSPRYYTCSSVFSWIGVVLFHSPASAQLHWCTWGVAVLSWPLLFNMPGILSP